jgi:hypothetical protein
MAVAVLPPSFFFIFVMFVSKSIVFLFAPLLLSLPLFVLPRGAQGNTKHYVIKQTRRPNRYPNKILGKHRSKLIEMETKGPENITVE